MRWLTRCPRCKGEVAMTKRPYERILDDRLPWMEQIGNLSRGVRAVIMNDLDFHSAAKLERWPQYGVDGDYGHIDVLWSIGVKRGYIVCLGRSR